MRNEPNAYDQMRLRQFVQIRGAKMTSSLGFGVVLRAWRNRPLKRRKDRPKWKRDRS